MPLQNSYFLQTEHIRIRIIEKNDNKDLFELRTNIDVNKYINRDLPQSISEINEYLEKLMISIRNGKSVYWCLELNDKNTFIGTICLWNINKTESTADIGYELLPQYQGKGYMFEAVQEVVKYGISKIKLKRIDGFTHKDNLASEKLLQKSKFKKNTELKNKLANEPGMKEMVIYSLQS